MSLLAHHKVIGKAFPTVFLDSHMEAHSKRPKKLVKPDGKALKMFHAEQL